MLELRKGKNAVDSKLIGTFKTTDECFTAMWEREGFNPPYFRVWGTDECKTVDYGSHTLFYYIFDVTINRK